MGSFSKNQVLVAFGTILLLAVIAGGVLAVSEGFGMEGRNHFGKWYKHQTKENDAEKGSRGNLSRTVANTASGADITFTPVTPADSGSISEMNAEFQILRGSALLQNTSYKADMVESSGALRISVTSTIPDVVKLIQSKAITGESGTFGVELLTQSSQSVSSGDGYSNEKESKRGKEGGNRDAHGRESE